jgi:hypothetical protein
MISKLGYCAPGAERRVMAHRNLASRIHVRNVLVLRLPIETTPENGQTRTDANEPDRTFAHSVIAQFRIF